MILPDTVLRAIATTAPQNLTSLHAVSGMTPAKVDRYGADLIALCRGTAATSPSSTKPISLPAKVRVPSKPTDDSPLILSEAQRSRRTPTPSTPRTPSESLQSRASRPAATSTSSAVHPNKRPAPPPPAPELTSAQLELESRLKDWRREEAKQAGLPTFFIFSDTVLRNITLAAPTSLDDLRNVRGASPEKLSRFGATILNLCRA